tara:strand:+ start:2593 stop:3273 length:681 start_codon:yes stop_codon:yes gene_type:complete
MKNKARNSFNIPKDEKILKFRKTHYTNNYYLDFPLSKFKVLTNKAIYQNGSRIDITNIKFNAKVIKEGKNPERNFLNPPTTKQYNLFMYRRYCSIIVPVSTIYYYKDGKELSEFQPIPTNSDKLVNTDKDYIDFLRKYKFTFIPYFGDYEYFGFDRNPKFSGWGPVRLQEPENKLFMDYKDKYRKVTINEDNDFGPYLDSELFKDKFVHYVFNYLKDQHNLYNFKI